VKKSFRIANYLNIPTVRVNAGWKDTKDRDVLKRVISSFKEVLPYAKKYNVKMALENHGGLTSSPDNILEIIKKVPSPYFGTCPDFGNFSKDIRYQALQKILPYALHIHAKSYEFNTDGEEKNIDYKKILKILKNNNYQNYLSIEFEGEGDEKEGIKLTKSLIEKYI
jgi:sugar phosphate isomerase/epimerase